MRIERIEIHNYRQYRDVKYAFSQKGDVDLHIIKGKNGMGKTNLLNAITWCLYNKEPHLGIENSGEPKINKKVIKEKKKEGKEKAEICVRIQIEDHGTTIIFERKQEFKVEQPEFDYKSEFTVTEIKGKAEVYKDVDDCKRFVNLYMPENIREYFFFDGEHLEKYFIIEQGEKIKNAIEVISHVRLLNTMSSRLKNVIGEYNLEAGKKNKDINGLVKEENELEGSINKNNELINEVQRQILISENIINECSDFLKGKEGVPEKEKEFCELQEMIKEKEKELEQLKIRIHKFIVRYKTLFSFYPSIKETYEIICKKEEEGAFPPAIDKNFLKRMISYHKCLVCDRELGGDEEEHIQELLNKVSVTNSASYILHGIKDQLEEYLEEAKLYKDEKEKLFFRKRQIEDSLETYQERINKIDNELKQFMDKEKIKNMHSKRMTHAEQLKSNRIKKTKYEVETERLQEKLQDIKDKISKALSSAKELEEINKKIEFANKARDIVNEIEKEMMDEVREKITKETMNIFKQLEWKKDTFSYIELDENYNLEMYDVDGYPTVGTCSAGERALLALSFTLALQKVAGYDSMLFIDTPVGRIDSDNRKNFANVLNRVSHSKQVVITLTTSEYSQEIRDVFEPVNSTFVELVHSEEKQTEIMEV